MSSRTPPTPSDPGPEATSERHRPPAAQDHQPHPPNAPAASKGPPWGPRHEPDRRTETEIKWTHGGDRMTHRYIIRDVRQNQFGETVGMCGHVPVGWTYSTELWFWRDPLRSLTGYLAWNRVVGKDEA